MRCYNCETSPVSKGNKRMNNESMYDTFVKNRMDHETPSERPTSSPARITETSLPDFSFDADDALEDPEPVDDKRQAVGVDRSLGNFAEYMNHNADAVPMGEGESEEDARPDFAKNTYTEPFEFEDGSVSLPSPEIFNAYPPEVQRKIMEWTDRDFRARREDESRRQDAILRANIARDRSKTIVPVLIIVLAIVCALVTGIYTRNAIFSIAFLVVAVVVIITVAVGKYQKHQRKRQSPYMNQQPPYMNR